MKKLSENDIRPSELMEKQKMYLTIDNGRLLSKYEDFVSVCCPACNSKKSEYKFKLNGMKYEQCQECETMYINPRPPADVLGWFYEHSPNYEYWNSVVFPASEESRRERIFVPRVDRMLDLLNKYKVQKNSLLEIGPGFGTFCEEAISRNIFKRVVAVEPNKGLAETCRKKGIEVFEKPVEEIDLDEQDLFDVVANFEVLEHLVSPYEFLEASYKCLKPGGILMLTCPNGKGFDVETLVKDSDTVDHEHLNYFNPKSIEILFNRIGFDVLEVTTPGVLDADLVRNKILSGDFDVSNQPFLKRVLLDEWEQLGEPFQDFLTNNGLSSNMWIVAIKK